MPDDALRIVSQFDIGEITAGTEQAANAVKTGTTRMNGRSADPRELGEQRSSRHAGSHGLEGTFADYSRNRRSRRGDVRGEDRHG
jgi:hypothetical protein